MTVSSLVIYANTPNWITFTFIDYVLEGHRLVTFGKDNQKRAIG